MTDQQADSAAVRTEEPQGYQDRLDSAKGYEAARGATFRGRPVLPPVVERRTVRTPHEALTIWAEEVQATGDTESGPKGMDNRSPLLGESHEAQVKHLVEWTPGFTVAYDALKRAYVDDLPPLKGHVPVIESFAVALDGRLPFASTPRREPDDWSDIPAETVPNTRYDRA